MKIVHVKIFLLIDSWSKLCVLVSTRMIYRRDRDWTKKKRDSIAYGGRVKCIGYQVITKDFLLFDIAINRPFYDHRIEEIILCAATTSVIRTSNESHYDINCWKNRSYEVSFDCVTRCLWKYRVRDGVTDCLLTDEQYNDNNTCSRIQRHRFQCSSSELTCILVGAIGEQPVRMLEMNSTTRTIKFLSIIFDVKIGMIQVVLIFVNRWSIQSLM